MTGRHASSSSVFPGAENPKGPESRPAGSAVRRRRRRARLRGGPRRGGGGGGGGRRGAGVRRSFARARRSGASVRHRAEAGTEYGSAGREQLPVEEPGGL